jgi:hypothetical protein
MVAIFVQASNKEILNSNYSVETGSMIVSMVPADGAQDISVTEPLVVTFHQPVRLKNGSALTNSNVASVLTLKENNSAGTDVPFSATVNSDKTVITLTPSANLKSMQQYYFKVDTLENNQGINTLAESSTFTTELSTIGINKPSVSAITMYPNPASERIYIKSAEISKVSRVEVINSLGNIVRQLENPQAVGSELSVRVSDLPSGIYFVRVFSEGNNQTKRILIAR